MFIATPKARDSLFSAMLKSQGAQFKTQDPREHWTGATLGALTVQLRVRGRWHVASLPYKLILLGDSTMQACLSHDQRVPKRRRNKNCKKKIY